MSHTERIREAFERNKKALTLRPAIGKGTGVTRVETTNGATCLASEGEWKLTLDMPISEGGNGKGPSPGFFARSSLGGCLTIGYLMWAAHLGIPIERISVEIEADSDSRGFYDPESDAPKGFSEIRCIVEIVSPARREQIEKMLETADQGSTMFNLFTRPTRVMRELRLGASAAT